MKSPRELLGPVSALLESDVRDRVRRHGVILWLDLDGHYTDFVDRLITDSKAGQIPYAVHALRGSYLELLLSLENVAGGASPVPLLIHLPGCNEESVRQTPIYELYAAGVRYRKALDTLVQDAAVGRARPEQIAAWKEKPGPTLEAADAWLSGLLDAQEGGLSALLRAMQPTAVLDDLITGGPLAGRLGVSDNRDEAILWQQLGAWTGMPASWQQATATRSGQRAGNIAFAAASWALCVEYVEDLHRPPVSSYLADVRAFPDGIKKTCQKIASHLRERHPVFYARTVDDTEGLLEDEVDAARAEDLGQIDTFRFEEEKVLQAALSALAAAAWDLAAKWANLRTRGGSFWLKEKPERESAWQLLQAAAGLGQAIAAAGERLGEKESIAGAIERYVERGAAVDQAHRHLEQRRQALLYPQLPEFETLRVRLDAMRSTWRTWADAWACDFNALCKRHGFLPPTAQQQRTLFDEVVRPLCQESGATAYFVVDAFRFEMGAELCQRLRETPATTVQLKARLAELPTVTEVGMNVLAPVLAGGKLRPVVSSGSIAGFQSGEFRVDDPKSRKRAMQERVGGKTCPLLTLSEVRQRDADSLKQTMTQARLIVVHSQELDSSGEGGFGPAVFDGVMKDLVAAWQLLREAGVRRFVFTADHGFLLLDEQIPVVQPHGRKVDPKRRHVLSPVAADHSGQVRVALSDLGYDGCTDHLMMPETTALFDKGGRAPSFVHGGNSLQERVIPVLTVLHRAAVGGSELAYRITAESRDGVAGMHCMHLRLDVAAQHGLDFGGAQEQELAVLVAEDPDVQVELCQVRGKARLERGSIWAQVGESFELFFRLSGVTETRVRVEVEMAGAILGGPEARFGVAATRTPQLSGSERPASVSLPRKAEAWLEELPAGGVRQLFAHLQAHGNLTEPEATKILGGPRELRRFSIQFEEHCKKVPFVVRIDVIAGVKRYARDGVGS